MNFPCESGGEKDEQFYFIAADVFLRRLVINLHPPNLMVIALGADILFWIVGEIHRSYSLGAAVFRLLGDTDTNIAAGRAIGVERVVKADPLVCSRSNDTGEAFFSTLAAAPAAPPERMKRTTVVRMPAS
jgi:hypothetical protein